MSKTNDACTRKDLYHDSAMTGDELHVRERPPAESREQRSIRLIQECRAIALDDFNKELMSFFDLLTIE